MKKTDLKQQVTAAIQACLDKKAEELSILEMEKGSGAFTDYFVLCSGTNPRQVQAIADEVELRLKATGVPPAHVEGRACFFREGPQVLRSRAAVEDSQAAGAHGIGTQAANESCSEDEDNAAQTRFSDRRLSKERVVSNLTVRARLRN